MGKATRRPGGAAGDIWIWVATGTALLVIVGVIGFVAMRHTPSNGGTVSAMSMGGGYQRHPMGTPDPDTRPPSYGKAAGIADLYAYALANPDVLTYIPCTCGCGSMGHLSNYNCYVRAVSPGGSVAFDPHATGCQTCVEITRAVIEMRARGTPLPEIRDAIDARFAGTPTDTEYPPAV